MTAGRLFPPSDVQISVVVATLNAAATLARCLDSIRRQSHPNIDVLIVDGGSTDGTLDIVRSRQPAFRSLRYICEPDSGVYEALNKGIAASRGSWIHFMGADDTYYSDDALSTLAAHLDDRCDLVYGKACYEPPGRIVGGRFDRDQLFSYNICHQAILYRTELLRRMGGFNLSYKVYADWDLNLRCFARAVGTRFVDVVVCRFDVTGFSSRTRDDLFLSQRFDNVARLYGCSLWNARFRSARYSFLREAKVQRAGRRPLAALRFYGLFAVHALGARWARKMAGPSIDPAH